MAAPGGDAETCSVHIQEFECKFILIKPLRHRIFLKRVVSLIIPLPNVSVLDAHGLYFLLMSANQDACIDRR